MKPEYFAIYTASDFGTERVLVVRDGSGKKIGRPIDPFHVTGVPASSVDRARRCMKAARRVIEATGVGTYRLTFSQN